MKQQFHVITGYALYADAATRTGKALDRNFPKLVVLFFGEESVDEFTYRSHDAPADVPRDLEGSRNS